MTAVAQGLETTAAPAINSKVKPAVPAIDPRLKPAANILLIEAIVGSPDTLNILNVLLTEFISTLPNRPREISTPVGGTFDAIMKRVGTYVGAENCVTLSVQAQKELGAIKVEMRMSSGTTFFKYGAQFMSRLCEAECDALKLSFSTGGTSYVPSSPDFKRSLQRAVTKRKR